jgi:adenylate cyclase
LTVDNLQLTVDNLQLIWEVDEFHGKHEGLVVAEIELDNEEQSFEKPAFIGDEVTHDPRYYNANM